MPTASFTGADMLTLGHVPVEGGHVSGISQWKLVPGPEQIENVNELQRRVLCSANKRTAMSVWIVLPTLRVGVVCELEVDAALAPVHLQVGRVQHRRDPGGARREHPRRAPHGRPGQVEKCG